MSATRPTRAPIAQGTGSSKHHARDAYGAVLGEYLQLFQQRYFSGGFAPEPPPLSEAEQRVTAALVTAGEGLLRAEGVAFEAVPEGLRILPGPQSPMNRAAARASADGAQVIFSPAYALRDMSAGKFENGANTVVVGPQSLLEAPFSATLNHELGHQRGWARLLRAQPDLFFTQARSLDGAPMLGMARKPEYAFYLQLDEMPQFVRDSLFHAVKLRQATGPEETAAASDALRVSLGNATGVLKQQAALFGALKQALAESNPALQLSFFGEDGLFNGRAVLQNTQFLLPMSGEFDTTEPTPANVAAFAREIDVRLAMLEELYGGLCLAGGGLLQDKLPPAQVHQDVVAAARKLYAMQREGKGFLLRAAEAQSASPDALWR